MIYTDSAADRERVAMDIRAQQARERRKLEARVAELERQLAERDAEIAELRLLLTEKYAEIERLREKEMVR